MFSAPRLNVFSFGLFLVFVPTIAGLDKARSYLSEVAAARQEVIQTPTLTIQKLDLGELHAGKNRFTALVKNKTRNLLVLVLDLRTEPYIYPTTNWERPYLFFVWPGQEKQIAAEYEFDRLSSEASLRVAFSFPQVIADGVTYIPSAFFQRKYFVGSGNKAADYVPALRFQERDTEHFRIYFLPFSVAARDLNSIAGQRESAYKRVSKMLGVTYPDTIGLIFFPDGETKKRETGHTGVGLASEGTIVEVYNEETKLDPYHELTHIIAGQLGNPPAMFNEGFAVYVSELMGADALKSLGSPGMKADAAVATHRTAGKLIPLDKLFAFTDIGPEDSQPTISYPEAASFVKFLIEKYQLEKFRQAYNSLENGNDPATAHKNQESFREIYGKLPSELEPEWLASLASGGR